MNASITSTHALSLAPTETFVNSCSERSGLTEKRMFPAKTAERSAVQTCQGSWAITALSPGITTRRPESKTKQSLPVRLTQVLMMLDLGKIFGVKKGSWKRILAGVKHKRQRPKAQGCTLRCGWSQRVTQCEYSQPTTSKESICCHFQRASGQELIVTTLWNDQMLVRIRQSSL